VNANVDISRILSIRSVWTASERSKRIGASEVVKDLFFQFASVLQSERRFAGSEVLAKSAVSTRCLVEWP